MDFMEKMVFEFGIEDASISNSWSRFRRRVELVWGDGSLDKELTAQARVPSPAQVLKSGCGGIYL